MKITSSAFTQNSQIPSKYTCDGNDILPPLTISDVPPSAKSLTLIVDDPDAPVGTWVHWVVYNIAPQGKSLPAGRQEIPEGSVPLGAVQGENSAGIQDFHGPCPPSGTHRYFFKLYALDTTLNLENPKKQHLEEAMKNHILDSAELIGIYKRK